MRALHLMVPVFMLVQFFVILVGLVSAMLFADPQVALLPSKPARGDRARPTSNTRD